MLIDCDIVGEYIYVDWLWYCWWMHICWLILLSLVNTYMLNDGDFVGDFIYAKWMVMMWWTVCVNICIFVESYVHAFMTNSDRFYIQLRWLWCAVGIMRWQPRRCWWRYCMHLEVVSRNISCCGMSPSCYNNWCSMWMWLIDYMLVMLWSMWIGVYVHWWTLLMVVDNWIML